MPVDISVALRKALTKLEAERARIDRQIVGLRQVLGAASSASRDGGLVPAKRGSRRRRRMSTAERKAVGERMKAYWAKRRGEQGRKGGKRKK